MKILVVGGGGREHAIVWKLKQSPRVQKIYCAPGNAGISGLAECIPISADDTKKLLEFAIENKIDLTVVGPEVPLVSGIVDDFEKNGLRCFGPSKVAAQIEGSKVFSKQLMKKYGIPTGEYVEFSDSLKAKEYLKDAAYPIVIKADGLAAGKGVVIAQDFDEANRAVCDMMEDKIFKSAGNSIIVEEFLEGPEVSIMAFVDGKCIKPMMSARDHKRVYDNDSGPNTGGMGAISPAPGYTLDIGQYCMDNIFMPTVMAMNKEGMKFKGVLYFGLILTQKGPKVLEYNCRFGDPETQAVLPRLRTDLVDIIDAVIDEKLDNIDIEWREEETSCVIISSGGYPGKYQKGKAIYGLNSSFEDMILFHSGTKICDGSIVTDGGRVLGVVSIKESVSKASDAVYSVIDNIRFEGMHYRKDIGLSRNLHD